MFVTVLEMVGNGWNGLTWLDMAENCCKWLGIIGIAVNGHCWKWLRMVRNGYKWLDSWKDPDDVLTAMTSISCLSGFIVVI